MNRRLAWFEVASLLVVVLGMSLIAGSATGATPAATAPSAPVVVQTKPDKRKPKTTPAKPAESSEAGSRIEEPATSSSLPEPAAPAPLAPGDGSCAREQIDKLTRELDRWIRQYEEAEKTLASDLHCDHPDVVCLDRFGELNKDALPARVESGKGLSVHVLLPTAETGSLTISTAYRSHRGQAFGPAESPVPPKPPVASGTGPETVCGLTTSERDRIRNSAMPIAVLASRPGLDSLGVPPFSWTDGYWSPMTDGRIIEDWTAWIEAQRGQRSATFTSIGSRLDVPGGDMVNIDFARTEHGARTASVERHYEVPIDNGAYYLELAVLVPFVYKGERTAQFVPVAGSADLRLGIEEDWHVTGAAMIQYFPFGRQRSQTVSFRNCRFASCVENWLGAQLGTGFSHPLREWYLGLVFEPVSGFNLVAGASMLQGDFLSRGRAEGMLLPSPDPAASNSQYMFRPYFGFSFTLDIVETLDRAATYARQQ